MKNIKNYILIVSFTYIGIIVFLIFGTFINKKSYIELNTPESVSKDFEILKVEISKVKDEKCRNSLNNLLNNFIDNSYNGKVKINKLYDYISTSKITDDYDIIKEDCKINLDSIKKYDIDNKYLVRMSLQDNILQSHLYQYELKFNDKASNKYYDSISKIAYNTLKYSEVELLNDYLKIIGEK